MTIFLLALQAGVPPPPAVTKQDCPAAKAEGEVVVCAKADQEQFRLRPIPSRFARKKDGPGLEFDLGKGAKANLYSTGEASPDGKPDKRIMAKFRIPF